MKRFALIFLLVFLSGCEKEEKAKDAGNPMLDDEQARGVKPPRPRPDVVLPTSAAFSPDGKFLLVGFKPNSGNPHHRVLKLFDVKRGKEIRTLPGHKGGVDFVTFFPDGKQALSAGADNSCKIWNLEAGTEVRKFTNADSGMTFDMVPLTPDGKKALNYTGNFATPPSLELWDVEKGKLLEAYPEHKNPITSITISPDGKLAIFGCGPFSSRGGDETIRTSLQIWNIPKGKVDFSSGNKAGGLAGPASFSPNGKWAVSNKWRLLGGAEQGVKDSVVLWDVKTGKEIREIEDSTGGHAITFTSDGKSIVLIDFSYRLRRYEVKTGRQLLEKNVSGAIHPQVIVFSSDGNMVFLGRGHGAPDIEYLDLEVWDTATGEKERKLVPKKVPFSRKWERD